MQLAQLGSDSAVGCEQRPAIRVERPRLDVEAEMQQRLAELKTEQQRLERERAALEETRRRQTEFTSGRQEVIQNLTRGIAQLEEGELSHRREAELRTRSLADMREALSKVVSVSQETWNKETLEIEHEIRLALVLVPRTR